MNKPLRGTSLKTTHNLAKKLKGCWPLNEGTGDKVFDYSGNNNTGTFTAMDAATDWVNTERGWGVDLDGVDDWINCGAGRSLDITGNKLTLSVWIRTTEATAGWDKIVTKQVTPSADPWSRYVMQRENATGKIQFGISTGGAGTITTVTSTTSITPNKWIHLVGVYDGVNLKLYWNGKLDNTAAKNGNIATTTEPVAIGKNTVSGGEEFRGVISSVYIWDRALSAGEVLQLYLNPYSMFDTELKLFLVHVLPVLKIRIRSKYDMGGKMTINLRSKYSIFNTLKINLRSKYSILTKMRILLRSKYDILRKISMVYQTRYNVVPARVQWRTSTDGLISSIEEVIDVGATSTAIILHLWNSKDEPAALTMTNCKLSASLSDGTFTGGTDEQGQEAVTEKWVELKSNGVSGSGITDDAQASFTPVGGDPAVGGNALSIGDIPPNTARHIHFRLNIPASPTTEFSAFPELLFSYDMV